MINYSIVMRSVNANLFEINQAKNRMNAAIKAGETTVDLNATEDKKPTTDENPGQTPGNTPGNNTQQNSGQNTQTPPSGNQGTQTPSGDDDDMGD